MNSGGAEKLAAMQLPNKHSGSKQPVRGPRFNISHSIVLDYLRLLIV